MNGSWNVNESIELQQTRLAMYRKWHLLSHTLCFAVFRISKETAEAIGTWEFNEDCLLCHALYRNVYIRANKYMHRYRSRGLMTNGTWVHFAMCRMYLILDSYTQTHVYKGHMKLPFRLWRDGGNISPFSFPLHLVTQPNDRNSVC